MKAIELIKKYTGHVEVILTDRGNTAIFAALYCARKKNSRKTVLVPDQGGWFTYLKYPRMLGMTVKKIITDRGVIDPASLLQEEANCLIYSNPAGYYAEQQIEEIDKACCKKGIQVIMDVTGCIGDKELCKGRYADYMVGSFGMWKPVNALYGGFFSAQKKEDIKRAREIKKTIEFDDSFHEVIEAKLKGAPARLARFYKEAEKIKKDLSSCDVLHPQKKGINAIVRFTSEEEKRAILSYCEKHKYEFTICPRYIRVTDQAVSIEVKRMG